MYKQNLYLVSKWGKVFKNIEEIKKFIEQENIVNLDIRSISKEGINCVTFNARLVDKILGEKFEDENISISGIDLTSSFVEVFLAHKTLVFFADDMYSYPEGTRRYGVEIKYSFAITDNKVDFWASPDRDNYRDFVGEVVSSLHDINEKVTYFYCDEDNLHSIALQNSSKYSLEKVKYAILMVAKAYNVSIDKSRGVFNKL